MEKKELKPAGVFSFFDEICQVPRPSKHEGQMIAYLQKFGQKYGIETLTDEAGNVLMRKPATPGMENRVTVALQSHIDMVCDKRSDTKHDFLKDPIRTEIDGEWLKAVGTTLGADNGIGVATELAILADDSIPHGPLECLFTVDEETGLTGAFALKPGVLKAGILLNLDSEDEGQIFIGCAGGVDTIGEWSYTEEAVPAGYYTACVEVKGLLGGHSGGDIHLQRACANKLLCRYLTKIGKQTDLLICEIDGGNLRNAIAAAAKAVIAVPADDKHLLSTVLNQFVAEAKAEFAVSDPGLEMQLHTETPRQTAIDRETAAKVLQTLYALPHGVYAMSQDVEGLVETSSNLASVKMHPDHKIVICTSQRSSANSSKEDIATMVETVMQLGGGKVEHSDGYPGWKPNPKSAILQIARESYCRLFGKEPLVLAIHAGLECGLFLDKYPGLDMISFGPTLRDVHTPNERMLIPTVELFWKHLLDILAHIPEKDQSA